MADKFIIGCDVDGVLADFNTAYRQRLIDVTGRELIPPFVDGHEPSKWYYATDEYGYTKAEDDAVWKNIIADMYFWNSLCSYQDAKDFLATLYYDFDQAYFITTRPGYRVKIQTEQWLRGHCYADPTVLIAKNAIAKGQIAAGLGLTHFIDDRPDNCFAVSQFSPNTRVFLLRHKYNETVTADNYDQLQAAWRVKHTDDPPMSFAPITIINSLTEFMQALHDDNTRPDRLPKTGSETCEKCGMGISQPPCPHGKTLLTCSECYFDQGRTGYSRW